MLINDGELLVLSFVAIVYDKLTLIIGILADVKHSPCRERLDRVEFFA
jgi:hypothetical protein